MSAPWLRHSEASTVSSSSKGASVWSEHVANDNRTYYWNSETKTSSWEKPDALKTPEELAAARGQVVAKPDSADDWKEYETAEGKKYYHNHVTNVTTWDKPDVLAAAEAEKSAQAERERAANHAQSHDDVEEEIQQELERTDRITMVGKDGRAITAAMYALSDDAVPVFKSTEQAEEAFHRMLRKSGVQPDWTWQQTIKAAIKDPVWRVIPDAVRRKAIFEQYLVDMKKATIGKQKDRIEKLRRDFDLMLRRHDEIKSYSRWQNVKGNLEGEVAYKAAIDDQEREALFDIHLEMLREREIQEDRDARKEAKQALDVILAELKLDEKTRWADAQRRVQESEQFQSNEKTKEMSSIDMLLSFQDHVKELERARSQEVRRTRVLQRKQQRENREAFLALLGDLRSRGEIYAGMMWKQFYPLIHEKAEYDALVGQPGSTPLDFFFDVVEELDQEQHDRKVMVSKVLDAKDTQVTVEMQFSEFETIMNADNRTSHMTERTLSAIFQQLKEKAQRRAEEERKDKERRTRRKQDDLRSAMKKLNPPIGVDDTYAATRIRISMLIEFTALESEEDRSAAFDKYIRRLKERIEEEEERASRRERRSHRRGSSRERRHERGRRSSRDSWRSGAVDERDSRHESRRRKTDTHDSPMEADPRSPKRARRTNGDSSRPAPDDHAMLDYGDGTSSAINHEIAIASTNGTKHTEGGDAVAALPANGDANDSSEEGEIAE